MESLFNTLFSFREKNHGVRGCGIYCNNPILTPIYATLKALKEKIEEEFQNYRGIPFDITFSKGQTLFPSILHICILPPNQKVSDGIYAGICFDKYGKGVVAGCMGSVSHPRGLNIKIIDKKKIDVDGLRPTTKYNKCFLNPAIFYKNQFNSEDILFHLKKSVDLSLIHLGLIAMPEPKPYKTQETVTSVYDPGTTYNTKQTKLRYVQYRQGQPKFREDLLKAYNGKCAISNCDITSILEAAHLTAYQGIETNNIQNGILLRADLHALYDLGLLTINAINNHVILHPSLKHTEYYEKYHNIPITLPDNKKDHPSVKSLAYHNEEIFWEDYGL